MSRGLEFDAGELAGPPDGPEQGPTSARREDDPARQAVLLVVAFLLGLLAGARDLLEPGLHLPLMLVGLFAFALALAHPRGAWRYALLVGLGIPLARTTADVAGYSTPAEGGVLLAFLAVVPALLGGAVGMISGRRLRGARRVAPSIDP